MEQTDKGRLFFKEEIHIPTPWGYLAGTCIRKNFCF
jgi:hypothetical protein